MLSHLDNCLAFKYVAVDTEGFAPKPLGLSVAHPLLEGMYFPLNHMEDVNIDQEIHDAIVHTLTTVPYRVFHHAGHDITILPDLANLPFVCTMVMAHMLHENLFSKGLDFLHKTLTGKDGKIKPPVMQSIIDTMGWDYVPFELMNEYATEDAVITMELFLNLLPQFESEFGPLWTQALEK